ncbi:MAG: hypothetical protein J0I32_22785 [Sphingobacteriales bacterium]|jgi:uncharacterized damage-inducible protein DinB|nr:hypothetical protein [Sphingobacteriales bacterium]
MVCESFLEQLNELSFLLHKLHADDYTYKSSLLGDASIGQHVRHIIELSQCLLQGYAEGIVNYDARKRDAQIESEKDFALHCIQQLSCSMDRPDKPLLLIQGNDTANSLSSYYYRELMYNTEHTIHHKALIRVALREMKLPLVDDDFGVAPSTIQYRSSH